MVMDAPETLRQHKGKLWQPRNYTKKFSGLISLREALAKSVNSIAVHLADQIGIDVVKDFARRAGIDSTLADGLALALGSSEVTPLELVNAYASFVDPTSRGPARFIRRVDSRDGVEYPELPAERSAEAPSPELCFLVRSLLRSVVTDGTGKRLRSLKQQVGGKTGTTNGAKDAWFVGVLPDVAMVSWVGFDDGRSLGRKESGSRTALPMVRHYLEKAELEGPQWPEPPEGIETHDVVPDGRLAPAEAIEKRTEYFLAGTEPTEAAPAPNEIDEDSFHFGAPASGKDKEQPAENRPALAVPSVDVRPLPPNLKPIMPTPIEAAPEPETVEQDEDRPL
jgi:penicillin-binding protein 1A